MEKDKAEMGAVNVWDGCYSTKQGGQGRPHTKMTFGKILKETKEQACGPSVLGREHRIWENPVKISGLTCSQETVLKYSKRGEEWIREERGRRADDIGPCQPLVWTSA